MTHKDWQIILVNQSQLRVFGEKIIFLTRFHKKYFLFVSIISSISFGFSIGTYVYCGFASTIVARATGSEEFGPCQATEQARIHKNLSGAKIFG